MALSYLNVVNRVLRRLRERPVSAVEQTPYSTLIGVFVNDSKRSTEDAFNWLALKKTVVVTTAPGEYRYSFPTVGDEDIIRFRVKVLSVLQQGTGRYLRQAPVGYLDRMFNVDNVNSGQPVYYGFNGYNADNDPEVTLWPIPNAVELYNFNLIIPDDELKLDSDKIMVPADVVELGAYLRALGERGEDGSVAYERAMTEWKDLLAAAAAQEGELDTSTTDFYAV